MTADLGEIERLQSRFERERRARRQAEQIAERGMRELWEANADLHQRVAQRAAGFEHVIQGLEYVYTTRLRMIADRTGQIGAGFDPGFDPRLDPGAEADAIALPLVQIRALADVSPPPARAAAADCGVHEVIDLLLARWQRPAARNGLLLSFDVAGEPESPALDWRLLVALTDTLVAAVVRHGQTGSMTASVELDADALQIRFVAGGSDPSHDVVDGWSGLGTIASDLAVVEQMVLDAAGGWSVWHDGANISRIELRVPRQR